MTDRQSYNPHTPVLLRRGESEWNKQNLFSGWADIDLSDRDCPKAREAALTLKRHEKEYKMSITLKEEHGGKMLTVYVSGKLVKADYETFVPAFERLLREHGKLRLLFDMAEFHGWEAAALWEDVKFDVRHFSDIERLAMVGDNRWHKGMATFCKPFTTAKIRYFDRADGDVARTWLTGDPGNGGDQPE